jgi:hypothetical protein
MTIRINFLTWTQEADNGREIRLTPLAYQAYYYMDGEDHIDESLYTLYVHFEGDVEWSAFEGIGINMLTTLLEDLRKSKATEVGSFSEKFLGL